MTSRGSERESEEDRNKSATRGELARGYEDHARNRMDEMSANAVSTRCYTRVSGVVQSREMFVSECE